VSTPKNILVAVAWPYANGEPHIGHICGAYLPADIFARYHRRVGNKVLMVSGSDAHGTPITVRADQEGVSPEEIVNRYHPIWVEVWEKLGVSFDLFTTTMTENHRAVVHDMFNTLREHGFMTKEKFEQFYDPKAERFLPDRYIEGKCPHCGYENARGDQCENCGRTLDPEELINPRSRLSEATPIKRETEHFVLELSKLEKPLLSWLETRQNWRKHVINWSIQFVKDGLNDRAITRDLTWGVPVPNDELGEGKRIYVWFEAVIGYLSASKEWAQKNGNADAWQDWWTNPEAESYYFVGKDNIPFHTVIWPAMLIGYEGLDLPTNVPANQYVTFKGAKASKSAGVGRSFRDYMKVVQIDSLRYALATVLPEQNDTDFSEEDLARRVNDELAAVWGNLVNRVHVLVHKNFDGEIPPLTNLESVDDKLLEVVDSAIEESAQQLEAVELRAALRSAVGAASAINAYLNETEPWNVIKTDRERTATILSTALAAIAGTNVMFSPYLPASSSAIAQSLGTSENGWKREELSTENKLGNLQPLFPKVELPLFPDEE
jgi:methionyl-tRNA synthetase